MMIALDLLKYYILSTACDNANRIASLFPKDSLCMWSSINWKKAQSRFAANVLI